MFQSVGRFACVLTVLAGAASLSPTTARAAVITYTEKMPAATRLPLPLYRWENTSVKPKAAMLLLHGFPMHGRTFDKFAREMVDLGFVVYSVDMRGLGDNYFQSLSPRLEYLTHTDNDLAQVGAHIRATHPGLKLFVTGESMGGSFALRMAALHPKLVDGVISSGPGLILCRHYLRLIPEGFISIVTQRRKVDFTTEMRDFFSSDANVTKELLHDPLVRRKFTVAELMQTKQVAKRTSALVSSIPAHIPVLVLQANDDRMCHPSGANLLQRELQTTDLTIARFNNRGHVLLETSYLRKDTLKSVTDWLSTHVK